MRNCLLLCISFYLLTACGESADTASPSVQQGVPQAPKQEAVAKADLTNLPPCVADETILLNGGSGTINMPVLHSLAIRKINMNAQTDVGDVARDGYTICLSDYPLDAASIWSRPPSTTQHKVELRVFIPKGLDYLKTGLYGSASSGPLQMAPILYLGENTHAFTGSDLGRLLITEVSETKICGHMRAETKFGQKLEGSFIAEILPNQDLH